MGKVFMALIAAFAIASVTTVSKAEDRYGKQKVVYHINYDGGDGDKRYQGALRNVQNHINAVGAENIEVKIVLHGKGVDLLASAKGNQKLQSSVTSLKTQNVSFNICNNTLRSRKISYENDLFEVFEEDIVPSGVAEISHLQQQGYTYIKP